MDRDSAKLSSLFSKNISNTKLRTLRNKRYSRIDKTEKSKRLTSEPWRKPWFLQRQIYWQLLLYLLIGLLQYL